MQEVETHQGQWWSIISMQRLHTLNRMEEGVGKLGTSADSRIVGSMVNRTANLQWCARSGLKELHFLQCVPVSPSQTICGPLLSRGARP